MAEDASFVMPMMRLISAYESGRAQKAGADTAGGSSTGRKETLGEQKLRLEKEAGWVPDDD